MAINFAPLSPSPSPLHLLRIDIKRFLLQHLRAWQGDPLLYIASCRSPATAARYHHDHVLHKITVTLLAWIWFTTFED